METIVNSITSLIIADDVGGLKTRLSSDIEAKKLISYRSFSVITYAKSADMVQLLIDNGANVNSEYTKSYFGLEWKLSILPYFMTPFIYRATYVSRGIDEYSDNKLV
jgi:ankyrin repeat protein